MKTGIVWFRQDLRLADNPALYEASRHCDRLVLVYIYAPGEGGEWAPGRASQWWLHNSLKSLEDSIDRLGGKLIIRSGSSIRLLTEIVAKTHADSIYFNRQYEPALIERDQKVIRTLKQMGVHSQISNGSLLFNPEAIATQTDSRYRVFTPFWKKCQPLLPSDNPLPSPSNLSHAQHTLETLTIGELGLKPQIQWFDDMELTWQPGERGAGVQLNNFCEQALVTYDELRNRPDVSGTSSLSPYLHFGEIGPRQILWQLRLAEREQASGMFRSIDTFIKELGWREFAHYILFHFPHTTNEPLNKRYMNFPFSSDSDKLMRAWQTGTTGYPLVDAGMRQLWKTGWMHNRVRMITASFLTKNCLLPWQDGARWFWDTLVDANLASNSFNWQWAAGCGADAAPYFRIFNPVTQSKKFDPSGRYIKHWIPELSHLPEKYVHTPWKKPIELITDHKPDSAAHYPPPILDLSETRRHALDVYKQHLNTHP